MLSNHKEPETIIESVSGRRHPCLRHHLTKAIGRESTIRVVELSNRWKCRGPSYG